MGIRDRVADARFCKPLDTALVERLAREHEILVTVEDGAVGGFASHVLQHLASRDLLGLLQFRSFTLPDAFVSHGTPAEQYAEAGLDSAAIAAGIRNLRASSSMMPAFKGYRRAPAHMGRSRH